MGRQRRAAARRRNPAHRAHPRAGAALASVTAAIGEFAGPALVGIGQSRRRGGQRLGGIGRRIDRRRRRASAIGPSSAAVSCSSGFFSSSCWMKAASSRCENCSSLIACCSCGVIARVWRDARMRLGPIRMYPHPEGLQDLQQGRLSKTRAKLGNACLVREDILFRPAGHVEPGPGRQEGEGRLGQLGPALAGQQGVELGLRGRAGAGHPRRRR